MHSEIEKLVITLLVMRSFSVLLGAPRACLDFREPTAVSRVINHGIIKFNDGLPGGPSFDNNGDFSGSGFFFGGFTNHGTLGGTGTIIGDVTNNGDFRPGDSPDAMAILGNYIENSSLYIELGGLNDLIPEYDYLNVFGSVYLGSSSLLDGFKTISHPLL